MSKFFTAFGELVNSKRYAHSLSYTELANRVRVSPGAVMAIIDGEPPQSSDIAAKLADVLQITKSEISALHPFLDSGLELYVFEGLIEQEIPSKPARAKHLVDLPPKDPLVRIEANADNKLELQSTFSEDDDLTTIETFRAEFLTILPTEIERYELNGNRPQAAHFLPRHEALFAELSKPVPKINFASVYLSVSRLNIARDQAIAELEKPSTEWPEFDPGEKEAIDTLCTLSGPLVMASAHARKLLNDAAMYNLREADEPETDRLLSHYIQEVRAADISTPETDQFLESVDIPADTDPNPKRTRQFKFALVSGLVGLTVSGALLTGIFVNPAVGTAIGAATLLPYIFGKKVIENDPDFKDLVKDGNASLQDVSQKLATGERSLVTKLGEVFRNNTARLRRLGAMVAEFKWVEPVLGAPPVPVDASNKERAQKEVVYGIIFFSEGIPEGDLTAARRHDNRWWQGRTDFDALDINFLTPTYFAPPESGLSYVILVENAPLPKPTIDLALRALKEVQDPRVRLYFITENENDLLKRLDGNILLSRTQLKVTSHQAISGTEVEYRQAIEVRLPGLTYV